MTKSIIIKKNGGPEILCGGNIPFTKWTVSPAVILILSGSNTRFPLEPIVISTAYAIPGKNMIIAASVATITALINFIINHTTTLSIIGKIS